MPSTKHADDEPYRNSRESLHIGEEPYNYPLRLWKGLKAAIPPRIAALGHPLQIEAHHNGHNWHRHWSLPQFQILKITLQVAYCAADMKIGCTPISIFISFLPAWYNMSGVRVRTAKLIILQQKKTSRQHPALWLLEQSKSYVKSFRIMLPLPRAGFQQRQIFGSAHNAWSCRLRFSTTSHKSNQTKISLLGFVL